MKCFGAALLLATACTAQARVKLPALISDHMLLQQGQPVRIWGWAEPGEAVRVEVQGQSATARGAASGRWEVWLQPLQPGGPLELTVAGENTVTVRDVLVGEVWAGSGQSNMGWTLRASRNGEQEVSRAEYPRIRLFKVKLTVADAPADDVEGSWAACTPETARDFSAVAYYFGREIHEKRGVPVGLIQTAWGGTPVEAWTRRGVMEADPSFQPVLEAWQRNLDAYPQAKARYDQGLAAWKASAAKVQADGGKPPAAPRAPLGPGHQWTPGGLYNAMVAPLTPFAIRGVIWYQGENNANRSGAYLYRELFPAMIDDWRRAWGQGAFPFLFVQLANFRTAPENQWPELRESQAMTLRLRKTGMAVTIDIGESGDIHPRNKEDVGRRLALAARHVAYGENIVYSGPLFRQATAGEGRLRVWFDHAGGGLEARGGAPAGFHIAGEDRRFVPAEARIEGATVVVSSPQVAAPVAVRYAWADDPQANLFNREGLPASPFRTDDWRD